MIPKLRWDVTERSYVLKEQCRDEVKKKGNRNEYIYGSASIAGHMKWMQMDSEEGVSVFRVWFWFWFFNHIILNLGLSFQTNGHCQISFWITLLSSILFSSSLIYPPNLVWLIINLIPLICICLRFVFFSYIYLK